MSNTVDLVPDNPRSRLRAATTPQRIAYATTTALAMLAFAGSGLANLFHVAHVAEDMGHLGYPPYFMTILGTWKVLGAIAIGVPGLARIKEWAYAGMMFDLTGAAASRAAANDGATLVLVPLGIACIVAVSWAMRPPSRRLTTPILEHRRQVEVT